tara:strand:- start:85 stop:249 length:165 start_codon:yes stop_codon:yes gene_type:complete
MLTLLALLACGDKAEDTATEETEETTEDTASEEESEEGEDTSSEEESEDTAEAE